MLPNIFLDASHMYTWDLSSNSAEGDVLSFEKKKKSMSMLFAYGTYRYVLLAQTPTLQVMNHCFFVAATSHHHPRLILSHTCYFASSHS